MVKILAVDPGGTTGWVRVEFDLDTETVLLTRWGTFNCLKDEVDSTRMMYHGADHVVYESYVIWPDMADVNIGSPLDAVKVIGRIELWVSHFGFGPRQVHTQTPSQAKQQWGNDRLKAHFPRHDLRPAGQPGVRVTRLCRHECDALRHAMTFIENQYNVALVLTDPEHLI